MNDVEIRKEIIETAVDMYRSGLVQGTGGNFSSRCEGGFIITPSGMVYELLAPGDLPKLSLGGEILEGSRTPSIESALHAAVYRMRPAVRDRRGLAAPSSALPHRQSGRDVRRRDSRCTIRADRYAGARAKRRGGARERCGRVDGESRSALRRREHAAGRRALRDAGNFRENIFHRRVGRRRKGADEGRSRKRSRRYGAALRTEMTNGNLAGK